MLKLLFTVNIIASLSLLNVNGFAASIIDHSDKSPIVITSDSLTADNKNSTALFNGSVKAKTSDVTMYSDTMTVYYDNSENKVNKIHAVGNVKVVKDEKALFSDEALYEEDAKKITFSGNPKAVEGGNVLSGKRIIFYFKEDRAVVEGSRVILQNKQGSN